MYRAALRCVCPVGARTPLEGGTLRARAKMGSILKLRSNHLAVLQTQIQGRFGACLEKCYNFGFCGPRKNPDHSCHKWAPSHAENGQNFLKRAARGLPQGGAHAPPAHRRNVESATQRDAYGEHHDERVGAAVEHLLERRASMKDGSGAAGSVPQQPKQQDQQVQQEAAARRVRWTDADGDAPFTARR